MKKKILIITTGGTIAMKYEAGTGVVPNEDLVTFLKTFPQLSEVAEIEVHEFSNIPSPWMTPDKMFELAKFVDEKILEYDGIVITHGTDTLEESSYLLDLVLTTRKPVIFTAAMRSGSALGLDGPRNIVGAVRVACSDESIDTGVLVVMNDEIHSAREIVKMDTGKVEAFLSVDSGILGIVDPDNIVYFKKSMYKGKIWTEKIDTNVELIKCTAGMSSMFINSCIDNDVRGIVLEGFGRGNIPKNIVPAVEEAIAKGIIVVICSRAYKGRVLPVYGYIGGGADLQQKGALLAGDLKGAKARLKLMALFGKYNNPELVRKSFKF